MKNVFLLAAISTMLTFSVKAQTATELLGKWKLVKWTSQNGKDKEVKDSTFQVFNDKNKFVSIYEGKETGGKWKLSKNNDKLTIRSGIITVNFKIDYFDTKKRIITSDQLGTLEYQKVE
ncbi:lipocalin family protein [Mucilaginibacter sp. ZT4R22]|uniref:Lipocalin family protein n=1 Tax=Mucilaginibacter pankratovii TaxID=2772110 RepID=A0ABR7WJZ0_9SPHI|nr:lipocalin family protein [Mucilaginibacter pankratovii]MBD1362639.1 lipocalin family protein [Mucilaginibacter pankratovii]